MSTLKITSKVVLDFKNTGSWRGLEKIAGDIITDLKNRNLHLFSFNNPNVVLGGGTRLMLDLNHRISHDIDLFVNNIQILDYFRPERNDFIDEICHENFSSGSEYIKLDLEDGQIDFIFGANLLPSSTPSKHPDTIFLVEPVAEVLAKKLYYRGNRLSKRDLFDWWAILEHKPESIENPQTKNELKTLLKDKLFGIDQALQILQKKDINDETWKGIQTHHQPDFNEAIYKAQQYLDDLKKKPNVKLF